MLPDFPEVKRRLLQVVAFNFRHRVNADELIGAIKSVPYFEGRRFATGDVDGYVEETAAELTSIPYEIERLAIIERGVEAFAEATAKVAEAQIAALHEMLFRKNKEACDRVGNSVDAGGQPFSADLYLKMLERVRIDFDSDGRPDISGTRLVMHPDLAEHVSKVMSQWETDESFQQRYQEVMLRKREEWRDRESNRKLVD